MKRSGVKTLYILHVGSVVLQFLHYPLYLLTSHAGKCQSTEYAVVHLGEALRYESEGHEFEPTIAAGERP
jgi:hypothetical protein